MCIIGMRVSILCSLYSEFNASYERRKIVRSRKGNQTRQARAKSEINTHCRYLLPIQHNVIPNIIYELIRPLYRLAHVVQQLVSRD